MDELLFAALARAAEWRLDEFNARDLANMGWSFAMPARFDELLFTVLARVSERRLREFNAQGLANTAWAFARVNLLDEKLFRALALEAERKVSGFNAQGLANTARAFARQRGQMQCCLRLSRGRWSCAQELPDMTIHFESNTLESEPDSMYSLTRVGALDKNSVAVLANAAGCACLWCIPFQVQLCITSYVAR